MSSGNTRRSFIQASAAVGTGFVISACGGGNKTSSEKQTSESSPKKKEPETGGEVTATEDLMREHGILRRALLVYAAVTKRLRANAASVPPDALQKTARLFRAFGEEYHEKKLEETYIFPAVKKAGGAAASYPDILVVQHDRGREITDYILSVTRGAKPGAANAESLAGALESFVLMYEHHAAREDTVIFPAWKKTLSEKQLDEMGEKFEEIEHQQFGKDGFDDAAKQISEIEGSLGLTDIAQFTAPPPPKS
ncbi:MAG: hemerythrin domain-containing protein [Acidobacteriota bacterium]